MYIHIAASTSRRVTAVTDVLLRTQPVLLYRRTAGFACVLQGKVDILVSNKNIPKPTLVLFMLPPKNFFPSLIIFHLFPLHSPITFFGLIDAPFGRFSRKVSRLNLNGKFY